MGAQFQQMTPDDIIRMFFGGDFGGNRNGFHFHTNFPQQRRRRRTNDGEDEPIQPLAYNLMQLLPIILVFFTMMLPSLTMMFGGNGSSNNGSMENVYFSLDKQAPFTLEKRTSLDTIYFVQPSRRGAWGHHQRYKSPKMEQEVESAYLNKLMNECQSSKDRNKEKMNKIKTKNAQKIDEKSAK